ncbi:IclR family transcriptional regulator [Microbacterium sp. SORGH_AS_0888]|uniref:IclR family transcriptional regulator n=1 Tax=Microbacterium sp. SORGH_AS_0888 TaxID=3041791 RepID=UPI002788E193|nr:IclR family transcriptional regulator [Microbacterium sp. SORGH_AS_0888]MDQ1129747.1 DNA-binding IclR family transcriptional regulator [Microbacterium sp. SORGH_AS_0888]
MAHRSAGESALHRHLRVLDAFDALHPFLTLSEIAAATGLAPSTAHRLVGELTAERLLERLPDRTYRLGLRLWEYAARTPGAIGLREIARPWLHSAHARIRQHIQLGVRAGTDVLFVERMSAPGAVINATLIGGRIPLHASSSGLVLLASAGEEAVRTVVASGLRAYTTLTPRTEAELRRVLRRVRSEDVADARGYIHREARGIAVPVRGPDGSVYAALGAVVPDTPGPAHETVETLRIAAAGVSRSLAEAYARGGGDAGWHGPGPDAGVPARSWEVAATLLRR